MILKNYAFLCLRFIVICRLAELAGYDLPIIFYGFSNILSGVTGEASSAGAQTGWHIEQDMQVYYLNKLTDNKGHLLDCIPSPKMLITAGTTIAGYQTPKKIFGNIYGGFYGILPYLFSASVQKNSSGVFSSGIGLGDFYAGIYLQWATRKHHEKPLFAHRVAFNVNFPSGKYESCALINAGSGVYYIAPEWAATLFIMPRWSISLDFFYIWTELNKKLNTQAGQTLYFNYSMEYEVFKNTYAALNGYFLQQYTDSQVNGFKVPGRRERLFSVGPGFLWAPKEQISLYGYCYFEKFARNRPEGINFIARLIVTF